jgi:ElaB/YqjD/DUF883 family membrane-anchored ribosome-binding protein
MPNSGFDRVMRGVRRGVVSHVDDQRTRAADGLAGIADMVSQLGEEFRGPLSNLSKTASARLQVTADRMREHDAAQLARSLARFAQDRPLLFIGGAFVLGLGVGRLLNTGDEE